MRIGVHGRAMEAVDAPVLMRTIEQMTAFGLEPVLQRAWPRGLPKSGAPYRGWS